MMDSDSKYKTSSINLHINNYIPIDYSNVKMPRITASNQYTTNMNNRNLFSRTTKLQKIENTESAELDDLTKKTSKQEISSQRRRSIIDYSSGFGGIEQSSWSRNQINLRDNNSHIEEENVFKITEEQNVDGSKNLYQPSTVRRNSSSFTIRQNDWVKNRVSVSSDGHKNQDSKCDTLSNFSKNQSKLHLPSTRNNFITEPTTHVKPSDRKLVRSISVGKDSLSSLSGTSQILPDILSSSRTSSSTNLYCSDSKLSDNGLGIRSTTLVKAWNRGSVLIDSIKRGRIRHVQLLLSAGMDSNTRDDNGTPALCIAISLTNPYLQLRLSEVLLQEGADVNARDALGRTPLMYACRSHISAENVLPLLLRQPHTELTLTDCKGNTALMTAVTSGVKEAVVLVLASYRALHHLELIGQRNSHGLTARQIAKRDNKQDIEELLRLEEIHSRPKAEGIADLPTTPLLLDRPPTP